MSGPKRDLSGDDRAVWNAYASTVRPIHPAGPLSAPPASAKAEPAIAMPPLAAAASPGGRGARGPLEIGSRGDGLDDRSYRALAGGRFAATRRLDLHGHRAEAAFLAVAAFLQAASAEGHRCVEIVTGHGSGPAGGVLKRELPHWLNRPELRRLVIAATHAQPGNAGALRLLLARRPR